MSSEPHLKYRADIDGLRALAVLSVVGFHAFPRIVRGGFVGVDIFFVISGFLISGLIYQSLEDGRFSYADFYARRIRRIFPALIAILAACLVYGLLFLFPNEYKDLGAQVAAGTGFIANLFFWQDSGYFALAEKLKPLLHLWSLGIEEQFYFIWPLLIAFVYRRAPTRLPWVIGCLLIISFVWNIAWVHARASAAFYLPMTRFWELLLGAMLAYAALSPVNTLSHRLLVAATGATDRRARFLSECISWIGVALLGAAIVLTDESKAFPGWWALLPTLGTLMVIAGRQSWFNRRLLANPVFVFVGLISYPLYLWHWVLLTGAARLSSWQLSRQQRLGAVAASFLLAWLTYVLIEKPIRAGVGGAKRVPILLGTGLLVGLAGLLVARTDGAVFRFPAQIQPLAAFKYDYNRAYRVDVCQLNDDVPLTHLAAECIEPPDGKSPLLVLWGDSHASSLYRGLLQARQSEAPRFRIAQITAGACPPLLDVRIGPRREYCKDFNTAAFARIEALKPDVVVLEAYWIRYVDNPGASAVELSALQNTVSQLEAGGVKHIVVFGDLPVWKMDQPNVVLKLWQDSHTIPWRTKSYLEENAFQMDSLVGAAIARTHATFVSPITLLCDGEGCLVSADHNVSVPIAWDRDHLTDAGSKLLVDLALPSLYLREDAPLDVPGAEPGGSDVGQSLAGE